MLAVVGSSSRADGRDAIGLVVVGWAFIGSGLVAASRRQHRSFGLLMIAIGFAWLARGLEVSENSVGFTVGILVSVLWIGLLVQAVAAFPSGRLDLPLTRAVVVVAYVVVTVFQFVYALFWNPVDFGDCSECPQNLLAFFSSESAADATTLFQVLLGGAAALVGAGIFARRYRRASTPGRRAMAPVLVTGALAIVLVPLSLGLDSAGLSTASDVVDLIAFFVLAAIPIAFLIGLLRGRFTQVAVSDLLLELGSAPPSPEELERALAKALRDPSLSIAYWVADTASFVDGHGRPMQLPPAGSERAVRILERDDRRVAALIHNAALADAPALLDSVAVTAGLSLENERLRAELRAQLAEVRTSRTRLLETADTERRRLERNLHDGAQQRLLGLGLALKLAQSRLDGTHSEVGELLAEADDELRAALEELRELARGIHPAILTDKGLATALPALASRTPIPVTIEAAPGERLPDPIEAAAYFVVSKALANVVKYASATKATVTVARANGVLIVDVTDNGVGGADLEAGTGLRGLVDRVNALDGELHIDSAPGRGTSVRAEIPCA